uniref:Uncharacterized protein n=1 Tax=Pithovirus LCPAC304 TaxID=2506594 RepID=A0A481Z7R7_9VIRU|nr:MAG: hypothetical protein LCPAC304_02850 [Pithovirus LCPAC304]
MGKSKPKSDVSSSESEESENEEYLPVEASNPVLMENMDALMKQLKEVLLAKEKTKILAGKKSQILVLLNKYQQILDKTSPEEHKEYFMKVYKRYRTVILANKNDRWLRTNEIKIVYGKSRFKIMLSAIYNTACNLADEANKKLKGLPDHAYENATDLIRKDIILLHLYRVFREFAPEIDQKQLTEIIVALQDTLGLDPETRDLETKSSPPANPMAGFGDMAANLMKGFTENSDGMPDLGKVFSKFLENDALKDVLGKVMNNLTESGIGTSGGGDSIQQLFSSVSSTLSTPDVNRTITTAIKDCLEGPKGIPSETTSHTSPNGPAEISQAPLLDLPIAPKD